MPSPARTLLVAFVSAWFLLGGLGHFVFTDFFVGIVPPYVPWPLAAVWVSGVFELLGAAALLVPAWRRLAACGLFILTLCVTRPTSTCGSTPTCSHPSRRRCWPLAWRCRRSSSAASWR